MYKHFTQWLMAFPIVLLLWPVDIVAQGDIVRVAVRANNGAGVAQARWGETMDYLSQSIPGKRFVMVPFEHNTALIQAVSRDEFDFVLTNPSAFVELKIRYGVKPLATLINKRQGKGYMQFGSVIFTRADRDDINSFEDLKGKVFIGADEIGFGGWRVAWRELLENNIDPFKDFKEVRFAGGIQNVVVNAVRDGKADAGSVRTDMLERLAAKGMINLSDFKVLGSKNIRDFPFLLSTPLYPEWSFSQTKTTPNLLAAQVLHALREISPDLMASRKGKYVGWVKSLDYSPVQELMEELNVGPFHITSHDALAIVWREYKYYVLAFVLGLIILVSVVIFNSRMK